MKKEHMSRMDFIIQTHVGLQRQGPGSAEMTVKALGFLDNHGITRVADLGCGTGKQTMVLAQHLSGSITGLDFIPDFISVFNDKAKNRGLQERVNGVVGSMENLPFQKDEFDIIWSEGAIDNIGFENGLIHWRGFLKEGGHVAVTCPSWFTNERPAEIEKFWSDAGCRLDTIGENVQIMQKAGYIPVATFAIPESCWTDNYFAPRQAAEKTLLQKNLGNEAVEGYIEGDEYEVELYSKYNRFYGYVFYIGKKY
jgi:ubiquinone/menaquinone biosynthesis C-methylase UbiE